MTFQNELTALRQFIEILRREQSALVKADVNQLLSISEEKSRQADKLSQLGQKRVALLSSLGISNSRSHVENWLQSQPKEIVDTWTALIEAVKTAQELNQVNGKLIESQLQHNQGALNTLVQAANQSAVYGADGQPRTIQPSSQRILGKG